MTGQTAGVRLYGSYDPDGHVKPCCKGVLWVYSSGAIVAIVLDGAAERDRDLSRTPASIRVFT